ncbi:MAG TPA: hypothetical protein ENG74_00850 [Thermoplasmatales archaeon]|nr:hypothetical protein [Thermoplasmatales archaeon]
MNRRDYLDARERALNSLKRAIEEGKADSDIISLLEVINRSEHMFTTSSCSGRIVIIEVPYPGAKPGATFLGKWHSEVTVDDVRDAIAKAKSGYLWFMVHPPIIHIVSDDIRMAERVVKAGLSSGFKNSGMRAASDKIVIELRSTERMDVLLGKDKKLYFSEGYIKLLCETSNYMLKKGKDKLKMLREEIEKFISKIE